MDRKRTKVLRNNIDLGPLCAKQTWDITQASAVKNRLLTLFMLGGCFEMCVDKDMRRKGLDLFSATPVILLFLSRGLSHRILLCETTIVLKYRVTERGILHLKRQLCLG